VTPSRTYLLLAENKSSRDKWILDLLAALPHLSKTAFAKNVSAIQLLLSSSHYIPLGNQNPSDSTMAFRPSISPRVESMRFETSPVGSLPSTTQFEPPRPSTPTMLVSTSDANLTGGKPEISPGEQKSSRMSLNSLLAW